MDPAASALCGRGKIGEIHSLWDAAHKLYFSAAIWSFVVINIISGIFPLHFVNPSLLLFKCCSWIRRAGFSPLGTKFPSSPKSCCSCQEPLALQFPPQVGSGELEGFWGLLSSGLSCVPAASEAWACWFIEGKGRLI